MVPEGALAASSVIPAVASPGGGEGAVAAFSSPVGAGPGHGWGELASFQSSDRGRPHDSTPLGAARHNGPQVQASAPKEAPTDSQHHGDHSASTARPPHGPPSSTHDPTQRPPHHDPTARPPHGHHDHPTLEKVPKTANQANFSNTQGHANFLKKDGARELFEYALQ